MSDEEQGNEQSDRIKLAEQVELGMEVKAFLSGRVGQYLLDRADEDRKEALDALAEADPEDAKAIRALQNKVKVIDSVQIWLADAINEATAADQTLTEMNQR